MRKSLATIGSELANVNTETNAVSPILEKEGRRKEQAKAARAAEVGAEAEVAHVLEVDHDHAPDPAPIGQGIVVEAEAVPAVREVAGDPALEHPGVLALPRAPRAGQRSLVGTRRRRPYAVPISRINVKPRSAHISTMVHAGSARKVAARRAKTASSNTLTNLVPLRGALQGGQHLLKRRGRKTRKNAKQMTDLTRLLLEDEARRREMTRAEKAKRNLLQDHLKAVVVKRARKIVNKRKPRSLLRVLLWPNVWLP